MQTGHKYDLVSSLNVLACFSLSCGMNQIHNSTLGKIFKWVLSAWRMLCFLYARQLAVAPNENSF